MDCQIPPFSSYVHALITFQLITIAKVLFIKLVEFIKRFKTARKLTKSVNVSQRYRARSEVVVGRMVGQLSLDPSVSNAKAAQIGTRENHVEQ